jgi:tetratricopeptide (TPR) repeat protein
MNMEHGNRRALARAILFLGDVALAQEDYTSARRSYQDSLSIYREFDHRLGTSLTLGGLGDVAVALGDIEGARQNFHEAYTMAQMIRDTPLQLWLLTGIASLLARENEEERAAELLGMVLNHYATTQEARDKAETILNRMGTTIHNSAINAALERGKHMANHRNQQRVSPEENRWLPLVT